MTEKKLTPKQQRFIDEYLIDLNGTQAAIRAGYSPKTANEIAAENLAKPSIKAAVDEAIAERAKKTEINQEYVINVIRETIERCSQAKPVVDLFGRPVMVETPDGTKAASYRFKEMAVLKGAELLMKHLGMGVERHDHTTNGESLNKASGVLLVPEGLKLEQWEQEASKKGEATSEE